MADSIIFDPALSTAERSLNGLSLRKDVIAQNVANVDTPGYKAQEVSFEGVLAQAIDRTNRLPLNTPNPKHQTGLSSENNDLFQVGLRKGGSARADGNNVDIDRELTDLAETGVRYQGLTTVVNLKLSLLKTIASDR